MIATTWPATEPACYGVVCYVHCCCARYHAVEGNSNPEQIFMGYCGPERAGFLPLAAHVVAGDRAVA